MRIKLAIVLALLALGVVGCSDSGGTGVASAGGTTTAPPTGGTSAGGGDSEMDQLLAYAQCMRDNGVPNFPDPQVGEGGQLTQELNGEGLDPETIEAAQEECRRLLPNGGVPPTMDPERLEQMRRFAQCMRDNGVSSFPDPSAEGLQINGNDPALDPNNPTFKAAQDECNDILGGPPGGGSGLSTGGTT